METQTRILKVRCLTTLFERDWQLTLTLVNQLISAEFVQVFRAYSLHARHNVHAWNDLKRLQTARQILKRQASWDSTMPRFPSVRLLFHFYRNQYVVRA
jgi:hypothetical protein